MAVEDDDLSALFAEARTAERPGEALTARVLADAAAVRAATGARIPRRRSRDSGFLDAVGGWPGLSGLAAAGVAGLAIGVFAMDALDLALGWQISGYLGADTAGFYPGIETLVSLSGEGGAL